MVIPEDAGLLSALGIGHARIERFVEMQVIQDLSIVGDRLLQFFEELAQKAHSKILKEGISDSVVSRQVVQLRFFGQDEPLSLDWEADLETAFTSRYQQLYGHIPEVKKIEVVSIRVVVSSVVVENSNNDSSCQDRKTVDVNEVSEMWIQDQWLKASIYDRSETQVGATIAGPALVFESYSATFIPNDWNGSINGSGSLILKHNVNLPSDYSKKHSSIRLELFVNSFTNIAKEMGTLLQRTAISTNVKERLDFSCALLDRHGNLIVNAPHIPVHLGALGLCVRSVMDVLKMRPGDTVMTNHPKFGGSHLPDITLISPVFVESQLIGFVASRSHHAELGGIRPGSMPPNARFLYEEGVVIEPMYVVKSGRANWDKVRLLLNARPYPSRSIDNNIADIRAALAANARGISGLESLAKRYGLDDFKNFIN